MRKITTVIIEGKEYDLVVFKGELTTKRDGYIGSFAFKAQKGDKYYPIIIKEQIKL